MDGDTQTFGTSETPKTAEVPEEVMAVARRIPKPEDGITEELITIPFIGRVGAGLFGKLGNLGIGFAILLIAAAFIGATGVWAAGHIGDPLIKAEVESKKQITEATVEKDRSIVKTQQKLTDVISQLVQTVESQRQETLRKEAVDRESWRNMSMSLQSIQIALQEINAEIKRNKGHN